ncbi:MAG: hypothetical protein J6N15_03370 [Ruminiclostridium sp.]|nr:hypothetical protein [Ruminiclostridium sp.]
MKELLETGVAAGLGYNESADALYGRIKGLSVVIKENDATKSYGCLIWVRKKNGADDELDRYLSQQVADKPHIIKHFKTTGRGAAVALVKYNDPVRNINNILRFLGELSADLQANDYVNCCYSCGGTDGLDIYVDGRSVVQYCENCRRGVPIENAVMESVSSAAGAETETPVKETAAEPVEEPVAEAAAEEETEDDASIDELVALAAKYTEPAVGGEELIDAINEAAAELKAEEIANSVEDLLAEVPAESVEPAVEEPVPEVMTADGDDTDIGDFMLTEVKNEPEAQKESGEDDPLYKGFEKVGARKREFEELMLSDEDSGADKADNETARESEDFAAPPDTGAENDTALDDLMFDADAAKAETAAETAPAETIDEEAFGNANLRDLVLADEQEIAEAGDEVVEVTAVTAIGEGFGEDLLVESEEIEEVGESDEIAVTEIYDDSNEGEDIEIEELESDFNKPTETKGGELGASETPLESDGSVPMVNPTSDFADNKPSSGRDPSAVRAFAYGSYDYGSTAEEPMGFDGRPKGYQGGDPRMGDEVGGVSRDYSRQQAAFAAPGANAPRPTMQKVVSKGGNRSKPINMKAKKVRSYSDGSHAFVGFIACLLFGLIGCALWCGTGYILGLMETMDAEVKLLASAVSGFLPTLFVFLGYRVGGDYFDGKGIAVSVVMSLIMDTVGIAAFLITGEMQKNSKELGYTLPVEKMLDNLKATFADSAASFNLKRQLLITCGVMLLTLIISIIVARKKNN